MGLGGLIGSLAAVLALSFGYFSSGEVSPYLYLPIFLMVGLARDGARAGRKSYIVDAAPSEERPLYTAAANTVAGVLTFAFIALGLLAQAQGVDAVLVALLVLGLLGVGVTWLMPKANRMVGNSNSPAR